MAAPVYSTVAQFRLLAPQAQAFIQTPDATIQAALSRRSRWLDGYLMSKFTLPLISWADDLTGYVIDAAAYDLMVTRGYNPESQDSTLRARYDDANLWAKSIPLATTPQVIDSSGSTTPGEGPIQPTVTSSVQRGFQQRPNENGPMGGQGWGVDGDW